MIEQVNPSDFFNNIIFSEFPLAKNDYGVAILAKDLEFKISEANKDIDDRIAQIYSPTEESVLLSYLAYKTGYVRFKKSITISFVMTSTTDLNIEKDEILGDGNFIYYVDGFVYVKAGVPTLVTATLKEVEKKEVAISNGSIFSHVPLDDVTYKECTSIRVLRDNKELLYSQNFVSLKSHYSIEFLADSKIQIVFKLSEKPTDDLVRIGDVVTIEYATAPDVTNPPLGVSFLNMSLDLNSVIEDVALVSHYTPPLSIEEMKYLVMFNRKNLGDLALNEDFRQLFLALTPNVPYLKVWQQREEARIEGFRCRDINRVFVCYLKEDKTDNDPIVNKFLRDSFYSHIYGRYLEIRKTTIIDLYVNINITTNDIFNPRIEEDIIKSLAGVYNNVDVVISKTIVVDRVMQVLRENLKLYEVDISLSSLGTYAPSIMYDLKRANVDIKFFAFETEDRRTIR